MSLQAAHAYDVEVLAHSGPASALNFPQSAQLAAALGKVQPADARPMSAGSGVSSTDIVLDMLASMTPQSTSRATGQPARQVGCLMSLSLDLLKRAAACAGVASSGNASPCCNLINAVGLC